VKSRETKKTPTPSTTKHQVVWGDAARMSVIPDGSVDLVVTSPPYPMIAMWDGIFGRQAHEISKTLEKEHGMVAFEAMHAILDKVWAHVWRVLKPGRFACVNIGDATRTIGGEFALYPNHARILTALVNLGFTPLPDILWRKQTNAPNKFMGSGMLPAGAYVTLEHEYILIVRKGGKRIFSKAADKQRRRESAFFWEERNVWFSDIWLDIKGSRQILADKALRQRSAAFPFDIPYRLINMYSIKGDTVLDPFMGTGTTTRAAMAAGRNSIGIEIDPHFKPAVLADPAAVCQLANARFDQRLENHRRFVRDRIDNGYRFKHVNAHYDFPVMTAQEKALRFDRPVSARTPAGRTAIVTYTADTGTTGRWMEIPPPQKGANPRQRSLFTMTDNRLEQRHQT